MAAVVSSITSFFSLFLLLLLHLGCFFFFPTTNTSTTNTSPAASPCHQLSNSKRRKISPISPLPTNPSTAASNPTPSGNNGSGSGSGSASSAISRSIRSYLKQVFSLHKPEARQPLPPAAIPPPFSPQHPFLSPIATPKSSILDKCKRPSFASRADIFPCHACGEVFNRTHLLDLHQSTKHALSELADGDSGKNIVNIIFQSGWKGRGTDVKGKCNDKEKKDVPAVHRILKIQNSPKTLARFEEYRDMVRSRAAVRAGGPQGRRSDEERCMADGNERLRFYCATYVCGLGREGAGGGGRTCGSAFCSTCGIVRHGFPGKAAIMDGITTQGTGAAAHASLPEDLEVEFGFMHVRRAMLVCRVVAGRVALGCAAEEEERKVSSGLYDSVLVTRKGGWGEDVEVEELVVFNPRAVLPCFVILYSV